MQALAVKTPTGTLLFESGRELPKVHVLHELLWQLDIAIQCKDMDCVRGLERLIQFLIPPGLYEGYLGDDLEISQVHVSPEAIVRKGSGANIHSFVVILDVLDGANSVGQEEMELFEFLKEVRRVRPPGKQHVGPRFWPF